MAAGTVAADATCRRTADERMCRGVCVPDYRDLPSYTVSEVAQCLCIPSATVRYWAKGRGDHKPVIAIPDYHRRPTLLSFFNLAELHVLSSIRREHKIPLPKVRVAQDHLIAIARELSESTHPLISYELQTDGLDIFVERVGALINASRGGQQEMRPLMEDVFKRIVRDRGGIPIRLRLFPRGDEQPEIAIVDPNLAGGRPVLKGTGIPLQVISERFVAGDSVNDLAYDYKREPGEIEEAIRWCQSAA